MARLRGPFFYPFFEKFIDKIKQVLYCLINGNEEGARVAREKGRRSRKPRKPLPKPKEVGHFVCPSLPALVSHHADAAHGVSLPPVGESGTHGKGKGPVSSH